MNSSSLAVDPPPGFGRTPPPNRTPGLARFREGALAHAAGLCALSVAAGVGTMPWQGVGWLAAASLASHLLLWCRIRTRDATRRADPAAGDRVACVHTLLTFCLLAMACAWLAPVRSVALQLMMVAIAFDVHRLSRRQGMCVGIAGLATAALALLSGDAQARRVDVVAAASCLAALAFVGHGMRSIQRRQQAQREALSAALAQWHTLSRHDALTGALCRRHGDELLAQEVARQQRDRRPFCVGLLDADHFKRINDTHGHALGDTVLVELVRLTQASLGAPNQVVRWGGEEFLLLLPAADLGEATRLLRQVRERIAGHDWSQHASGLVVDVSIGVAEHRPGDLADASVACADAALYVAKAEGRGRVVPHAR